MKLNIDINEWTRVLHKRFKKSIFSVITIIIKKRYIIKNVCCKREFIKYVYVIIRIVKIAKIITHV